jgi:hypothetical protein
VFVEIGDWRPLFPTRVGEEIGDIGAARLNAYVKELEQPLLSASKEFYAREASSWIGSDSCPEYLKKVHMICVIFRQTNIREYIRMACEIVKPVLIRANY